jgi:hypothetical protein
MHVYTCVNVRCVFLSDFVTFLSLAIRTGWTQNHSTNTNKYGRLSQTFFRTRGLDCAFRFTKKRVLTLSLRSSLACRLKINWASNSLFSIINVTRRAVKKGFQYSLYSYNVRHIKPVGEFSYTFWKHVNIHRIHQPRMILTLTLEQNKETIGFIITTHIYAPVHVNLEPGWCFMRLILVQTLCTPCCY